MPIIEQNTVAVEKGKGTMYITHLLTPAEMVGKCEMFAKVRIPVGCALGVHQHVGNNETYHIVQGKGLYTDNGTRSRRAIRPSARTATRTALKL